MRYRMALAPLRCLAKEKWWTIGTELESGRAVFGGFLVGFQQQGPE